MTALPAAETMYRALLTKDPAYEGIFVAAIRSTGIFCRPTCAARKPKAANVEYFASGDAAAAAGYRPCKRCRPQAAVGSPPSWLAPLLEAVDTTPGQRWTDHEVRTFGVDPARVRRWFQSHHQMTFHTYYRVRRLGRALDQMRQGQSLSASAFDNGFESVSGFRDAFAEWLGVPPGRATGASTLFVTRIVTPLGPMLAGATSRALCLLEFVDRRQLPHQIRTLQRRLTAEVCPGTNDIIDETEMQVRAYFGRTRTGFDIPVSAPGTPFQETVWAALTEIPYGETLSYRQLATRLRQPDAVRAVGRANGHNRLAIVIPCHRVVRHDGTLGGYGGGLHRKRRLLALERNGAETRPDQAEGSPRTSQTVVTH